MESIINKWYDYTADFLDDKTATSIILACVVIVISVLYYGYKNRGILPGPVGVPFLGYEPFLKDQTLQFTLTNLQKKYGDLFSFRVDGALFINMGSVKAMRELHVTKADCFERLSDYSFLSYIIPDGLGFANGEPWKVLRKFTGQQFRELGMNTMKEATKGPMYECIQDTIEYLRSKKDEPVEITQLLTDKCNAILRRTLFGDCGVTEQEVRELNEAYAAVMNFLTVKNFLHTGAFARYFRLPFKPGYKEAMKSHRIMQEILYKIVDDHKSKFDEEHPKDFIDAYFKERDERRSKGDPTADYFTDKALVSTLYQLVGDGVLSVAMFVSLFLKCVLDHEEEQEKIYSEIKEVVGKERAPSVEDKSKMVYTSAVLFEVMRTSDFFALFPSQQCIKETTVRGYKIPKGAMTLMNIYACHHCEEVYEEPEKFNPSRFIPEEGKQRPELPVSFGIGRRACMGEGYTMTQVFLFLTTIVQNFKLSVSKRSEESNVELILQGKMEIFAEPRN